MERVYNFAAGPSTAPLEVLCEVRDELLNYKNTGMSVMEMSHRSKDYAEIIGGAEESLRRIMGIPQEYAVLFLAGGATTQFSMLAMNLANRSDTADYAVTGLFAGNALNEGRRWCNAVEVASSGDKNFSYIPKITPEMLHKNAAYLHITGNNTVYGTAYNTLPETGGVPLVADMSSVLLGRRYDISKFALVYAGAQKNMSTTGVTVVIVRRDMIREDIDPVVPTMLRYHVMRDCGSMYNTPPTFSIYMAGLVFKWIEKQGGVEAMEKINTEKAALLYDCIDNSKFYNCPTAVEDRSIMNVPFTLAKPELTDEFLGFAKSRGLVSLKGHRAVGGCRASIYNAMPKEGVEALVKCMKDFELENR